MAPTIRVKIGSGDALVFACDVLALKYAGRLYGVDKAAVTQLLPADPSAPSQLPKADQHLLLNSSHKLGAKNLLLVGVVSLYQFRYREIREFAYRALATLAKEVPDARHVALTLHGVGYGLDETEAFESEIAGCVDAVSAGLVPEVLEQITFLDIRDDRVNRLQKVLNRLLPSGFIGTDKSAASAGANAATSAVLRAAGYASAAKPMVFVAMPFSDEMDDVFHYGIQGAVNGVGALCERADRSPFTGDIMDWVKERIGKASMVIADLTGANPNVYLEVGYAWGLRKQTILLVQDPEDLKFDLRGQRCLVYRKIRDLEQALAGELKVLLGSSTRP